MKNRGIFRVGAPGVDELDVGRKDTFRALVYQIDGHCKRLLRTGYGRTEATLAHFFEQAL